MPALSLAPPVIDDACLREFEDHVGDHLPRLMAMFRSDLGDVLRTLASTRDPAVMARAAHSVLSLAGGLGCAELVACARALETAGDADTPRLAAELTQAGARASAALDARYALDGHP